MVVVIVFFFLMLSLKKKFSYLSAITGLYFCMWPETVLHSMQQAKGLSTCAVDRQLREGSWC